MTFVFVSNFFNHHQLPVADYLYSLCNEHYYFVETCDIPQDRLNSGFEKIDRPYIIRAWESCAKKNHALDLCANADVLVCSSELSSLQFKKKRLKRGRLTFEYSERPLKRGFKNILSKTNLINQILYHTLYFRKPYYKLCAGAYVANDEYMMRSFKGKCYKYGYFPKVEDIDIDEIIANKPSRTSILWCARFLDWKHPEMVVDLAERMKANGFEFVINMIGSGPKFEEVEGMLSKRGMNESVHLLGNLPNTDVLNMMKESHIFLLTSDRREGWGAVVNEAMSSGCCVVASDSVGSVPFLIENNKNGYIYKTGDSLSLYEIVTRAINYPDERDQKIKAAYETISGEWSPRTAATNLFQLCSDLLYSKQCSILKGPCSVAIPLPENSIS